MKFLHLIEIFAIYPRRVVLKMIRWYQRTLSFDHGPLKEKFPIGFCRFYPSCSEYGYQAIEKYGLFKGMMKTCWRVLRCNPFSKGGIDPLK